MDTIAACQRLIIIAVLAFSKRDMQMSCLTTSTVYNRVLWASWPASAMFLYCYFLFRSMNDPTRIQLRWQCVEMFDSIQYPDYSAVLSHSPCAQERDECEAHAEGHAMPSYVLNTKKMTQ